MHALHLSAAAMLVCRVYVQSVHIASVSRLLQRCVYVVQSVPIATEESDSSDFVDSAEGQQLCLFIRYCGQRFSLLWTSVLRPCNGPV